MNIYAVTGIATLLMCGIAMVVYGASLHRRELSHRDSQEAPGSLNSFRLLWVLTARIRSEGLALVFYGGGFIVVAVGMIVMLTRYDVPAPAQGETYEQPASEQVTTTIDPTTTAPDPPTTTTTAALEPTTAPIDPTTTTASTTTTPTVPSSTTTSTTTQPTDPSTTTTAPTTTTLPAPPSTAIPGSSLMPSDRSVPRS